MISSPNNQKEKSNVDDLTKALVIIWHLSFAAANRAWMGSADLGLLDALISILSSDSEVVREGALNVIYNLCLHSPRTLST